MQLDQLDWKNYSALHVHLPQLIRERRHRGDIYLLSDGGVRRKIHLCWYRRTRYRSTEQAAVTDHNISCSENMAVDGVQLSKFIIDSTCDPDIRKLSAKTLLKQYVLRHWCSTSKTFQSPEISIENKIDIKALLPVGLQEPDNEIRDLVANVIAIIACWDWPENWPGLVEILVNNLSSENEFALLGSMRVLTKLFRHINNDYEKWKKIGPLIQKKIHRIIGDEDKYSVPVRCQAIGIFTIMFDKLLGQDCPPDLISQYLKPVTPMLCKKLIEGLRGENNSQNDFDLKAKIVEAIALLLTTIPDHVFSFLLEVMPLICKTLIDGAKMYIKKNLGRSMGIESQSQVTNGGVIYDTDELLGTITEVFISLIDPCFHRGSSDEFSLWFDDQWSSLPERVSPSALHYVVILTAIRDEQIETWNNNSAKFVIDEEREDSDDSVREKAQDLLGMIIGHPEEKVLDTLAKVVCKQLEKDRAIRLNGTDQLNHSWKLNEAFLVALSNIKDYLVNVKQFDIGPVLSDIILADLNNPASHPLLISRYLIVGGTYSQQMPWETKSRLINAIINALQVDKPILSRICAVKAANCWFRAVLDGGDKSDTNFLKPYLSPLFQGIFNLTCDLDSPAILGLIVLKSFGHLVPLDEKFTASVAREISMKTIELLLGLPEDYHLSNSCLNIFIKLAQNPICIGPLHRRMVPQLVQILSSDSSDESIDIMKRISALRVLEILVKHSPQPFNVDLMENVFSNSCQWILNFDDGRFLGAGAKLIWTYLSVAGERVIGYKDNSGRSGLQYIVNVTSHLVDSHTCSGDYRFDFENVWKIITWLMKASDKLQPEEIHVLLEHVLGKMQCENDETRLKSYSMIYANFLITQFDVVLDFFLTTSLPTGQSAVDFVIFDQFCRNYQTFDSEDRKIVIHALCKILKHGVRHHDSWLHQITVKGTEEGVTTMVPVLVEVTKLITSLVIPDGEV